MLTFSLLCSFRASIHLPSQTDVIIPGFRMKSEKSGGHWSLQIHVVLIYSVSVPVTTKYLCYNPFSYLVKMSELLDTNH